MENSSKIQLQSMLHREWFVTMFGKKKMTTCTYFLVDAKANLGKIH